MKNKTSKYARFFEIGAFCVLVFWVLYVVVPLFQSAFIPTHDGEYHIIRFAQFFESFRFGHSWFPRWAPSLNSGYGVPLFTFFYPLPNYLSLLFSAAGFSFVSSVKILSALGYITGVLFCYLWLRKVFSFIPSVLGTLAYASAPYWFVDIFIRGSVGESLAMGCFTVLLYAIAGKKRILIALSTGLLILSHNILAMLFIPVAILYAFVTSPVLMVFVFLGIGMTSWFFLPALFEQQFVTGLNTVNFREHFPEIYELLIPSWGTGFSGVGYVFNKMSLQIGVFPLFVFVLSVFVLLKNNQRNTNYVIYKFFSVLFVVSVFFMTKFSLFFWENLPLLPNVQYPWRLLSFVPVITGFMTAFIIHLRPVSLQTFLFFSIIPIIFVVSYVRPVQYEKREDSHYLTKREFTDGTSSLGNSFSTIYLPWQKNRTEKKIEPMKNDTIISDLALSPDLYSFSVETKSGDTVVVHTSYFPGWSVYVDKRRVEIDFSEGDIRFKAPEGKHLIEVKLEPTIDQSISYGISLLSLLFLLSFVFLRYTRSKLLK